MMTITPTRARFMAARANRTMTTPALPYTWYWLRNHRDNLWTIVVRITESGQQVRCSYAVDECPETGETIAARLYALATRDVRTPQTHTTPPRRAETRQPDPTPIQRPQRRSGAGFEGGV